MSLRWHFYPNTWGAKTILSRESNNYVRSARGDSPAPIQKMELDLTGGSYVALVTPFDNSREIDVPRLRDLLRFQLKSGTDGLVILGTTGEASLLSRDEKETVLRIVNEEISGKLPIIVGTGGISPAQVISNTEMAAKYGANGCLIVTPYYVKPTQKGLTKFFHHIADSTTLPIILYNVPGRTGVDMGLTAIKECSEHPRIVGIKDATGDISRVESLREQCGANFLLFSGDDETSCNFVLKGGDGVISVAANVIPQLTAEMIAKARSGKHEESKAINNVICPLHKRLFIESNPIPTKWALYHMNRIDFPYCRLPLTELQPENQPFVKEAMIAVGCI